MNEIMGWLKYKFKFFFKTKPIRSKIKIISVINFNN